MALYFSDFFVFIACNVALVFFPPFFSESLLISNPGLALGSFIIHIFTSKASYILIVICCFQVLL